MMNQGSPASHSEAPRSAAVIGLGYVGLPLALLLVEKGFVVYGIDVDERKVNRLISRSSYLPDVRDDQIAAAMDSGRFHPGTEMAKAGEGDAVIICVPTPLTSYHTPDHSYLQSAARSVGEHLRQGQTIILESSTYPGTTREVLVPMLEQTSGLRAGKDFHVGYSPERIDPGNSRYTVEQIPKLVSGLTVGCAERVEEIYSRVFQRIVLVSRLEIAEMAKIVENSHRLVNISFVNELAWICEKMDIDVWEVIDAAATKPFGFTAYYPGPGIGGHCIPVDPLYLQWKAKAYGAESRFIALSDQLNRSIPQLVADKVFELLRASDEKGQTGETARQPLIVIYGVAYKKDVNDVREAPALELIEILTSRGAAVVYHDPYVDRIEVSGHRFSSVELTDDLLQAADCVIILTDHTGIPAERIVRNARLVVDTRNATAGVSDSAGHVYRLGSGMKGWKGSKGWKGVAP